MCAVCCMILIGVCESEGVEWSACLHDMYVLYLIKVKSSHYLQLWELYSLLVFIVMS